MYKRFEIFSNEIQEKLSETFFNFGSQTKHSFEMQRKDTINYTQFSDDVSETDQTLVILTD